MCVCVWGGGGGALTPRIHSFVYIRNDLFMPLNWHLGPKLDCCAKPFLASGPNFGYKLLDSCSNAALFDSTWASMRLDLNEHWQFTQLPSYFESESSVQKIVLHHPKGDPNCWFCRGSAQENFKLGGRASTRMHNFVPKYTVIWWFGYATPWTFVAEFMLLYKVIADIRAKFWIKLGSWSNAA